MPQKESDLIPRMVAYLRRHLHDSAPTTEEPPIWWDVPPDVAQRKGVAVQLQGSANIRWLARACWLCWKPEDGVPACIAEYQRELALGHRGFEEMTVSHDGQWLGAHYAIRMWLLSNAERLQHSSLEVARLLDLNTAWCGAELALMREFYLPAIGVLCPAARFEGALVSSQRSTIARWDASATTNELHGQMVASLPKPKKAFNDTFCLKLAADLVAAGDDLGRSAAAIPKLAYPLFVKLGPGSLQAYWKPGKEVLKPILYVAWPTPIIPGDRMDGWVEQVKGLPKRIPAAGSTLPVEVGPGDFKQIG